MEERLFDIYAKFTVRARDEEHALELWDQDKAVFQEFEDIIEVPDFEMKARS